MTLGPRLFLSYLLVLVVGLATASIAISNLLSSYENDLSRQRLDDLAAPLVSAFQIGLRQSPQPRVIAVVEALAEQTRAAGARLLIVDGTGRVLVDGENRMLDQRIPPPDRGGLGSFRDGQDDWLFVQQSLRPPTLGTLVVARPRAAFADSLRRLAPSLAAALGAAAAVALVTAALLAGTISRPLRGLAATARRFAASDYSARVVVAGPPETKQLGGAFNDMAAEIGRARGTEQAFLADISHELRTPLTAIHGFAQAIVEGEASGDAVPRAASVIQRESRRLVRMVEGLLEVAKLQARTLPLEHDLVDPAKVLADTVDALAVQARDAAVAVDLQAGDLPRLRGDADRIAQVFVNVIDNAVRHSPRGSTVTVRASREGGRGTESVVVRVRDMGRGLPAGAGERLFARFWRGENAAGGGAGLGLAIAQAITEAHGGGISAANAPGGGAEFTVRLPAA